MNIRWSGSMDREVSDEDDRMDLNTTEDIETIENFLRSEAVIPEKMEVRFFMF